MLALLVSGSVLAQNITQAEYFINTDPGVGNGIPITIDNPNDTVIQAFSVPTGSLDFGPHTLWIRTMDANGSWSIYDDILFYVSDTTSLVTTQPQLVGAEYFFNTDPGVGNGIDIPITAGNMVEENFNINTIDLTVGIHYLYIRTVDQNGKWSLWLRKEIDVQIFPIGGIVSDSTLISCFGQCDGEATVTPTGGTPGWTFSWYTDDYSPMGNTDSVATGLCAGTYYCIVEDALGDKDTVEVIVTQPELFAAVPNPTTATCGEDNGVAAVNITGGTAPYTYNWAMGDTTESVDSLAGNALYQLMVTDSNNCISNANVFIPATPAISVDVDVQNPSCYNVCDAVLTPNVIGGQAPFNYYWTTNNTNEIQQNLCEGTYSVNVTDANGCIAKDTVEIINPDEISTTLSFNDANCGVENGNATVSASGGQAPYSFLWSTGKVGQTEDSLFAGTYTVTITDDGGCTRTETILISDVDGPIISVSSITDPLCIASSDGSINMTSNGSGTPFTYQWSNGAETEDINGLAAGPYELTVTDINGCSASESVMLSDPEEMNVSFNVIEANCGNADGVIITTVSGGSSPYYFDWSNGANTATAAGLSGGIYEVTITDDNGCEQIETIAMSEVNGPEVTVENVTVTACGFNDGAIETSATGGSGSLTYSWSSGQDTPNITNVGSGIYEVTVTDQANCSGVAVVEVPAVQPDPQQICLVTVDDASATNKVVWEKPLVQGGIGSYNVYRETSQFGVFQLIGNVPYTDQSEFTDVNANPAVQAYSYKVSVVDTCGNESNQSLHHKTIHLSLSSFAGDNFLNWTSYEGFSYSSFEIWKYSDELGWNLFQTVASNVNSYTDVSAVGTNIDYYVAAVPLGICTSTKANDYNSSRSNRSTGISVPGGNAPIANFTESTSQINEGQSIQFTDQSLNIPTSWFWTFEGGTPSTSTQQNPQVTYQTPGIYDVKLVVSNADGSDSIIKLDHIEVDVLGIKTFENQFDVKLYPNPTNDFFNLEMNYVGEVSFELCDVLGSIIQKRKIELNGFIHLKFNLGEFSKGSYILKIITPNGNIVKRLVKN